ncbi:hypothetical protein [Lysobacter silvisoli]|uniref:hypothetical protein n=1 Tax=Lysobacter silvisoli TaxID=2293254 RepID=UPI0013145140|nr:hypothetical protein [Lysobacter silvisoli]
MNLYEALSIILEMSEDHAVFAVKPFSPGSAAQIDRLDSNLSTPEHIKSAGFDYVIDTISAQEAVEVFGSYIPTREEVSRFLLHYAIFDSFPDWVYELQG